MAIASSLPAIAAAACVVFLNVTTRRAGLQRLGLSPAQFGPGLRTGLIGSAIMIPLVFLVAILTEFLWQLFHYDHPKEHDLLRLMGESPSTLVTTVLILSAIVIAPLWEEILFRGHLQTLITYALARLLSDPRQRGFDVVSPVTAQALDHATAPASDPAPWIRWVSITLTSLAFAVVHPAWTIPPIFFLSLCLGYAYERTGNLWTVMFMHAGFNTTSTLIYLLLVR
jgi:membrane protease YdiL (CAAX protease family)